MAYCGADNSVISLVIAILRFNSSGIKVGNILKDTINMVLDKSLNQTSLMSFLKGHLTDLEITRTRGYSPATHRLYSLFDGNPWKDQRLTQLGISFSTNSGFLANFCLISAAVKEKSVA